MSSGSRHHPWPPKCSRSAVAGAGADAGTNAEANSSKGEESPVTLSTNGAFPPDHLSLSLSLPTGRGPTPPLANRRSEPNYAPPCFPRREKCCRIVMISEFRVVFNGCILHTLMDFYG
jgi:hypothetical protein